MPDRVTNVYVLVEDIEQQNLVRRFLQRRLGSSYVERKVRYAPLPKGRGAGEQYVRTNYPNEVRALRSRLGKRVSSLLFVMLDADLVEVAERHRQLADALARSNCTPRDSAEPILVLVPKRHVETWIRALQGRGVDEETDYTRPTPTGDEVAAAAQVLCSALGPGAVPSSWPASLHASLPEWRRVPR